MHMGSSARRRAHAELLLILARNDRLFCFCSYSLPCRSAPLWPLRCLFAIHQRAWYDSHRESILKGHKAGGRGGGDDGDEQQSDPDGLNLFQYFSGSCYSDYSDGAEGFYTVYASIFEKLDALEMDAQKEAGQEETRQVSGNSDSD